MNIISFENFPRNNIAFCFVDNTNTYQSSIKELIKNQSDYTITNLYSKGHNVYQGTCEDSLLNHTANLGYNYAVIFSTGTEFINGDKFFENIGSLISKEFFIAGHILDRGDAYYELHHQCYVVNLIKYKQLGYPEIGQQELGALHVEVTPIRSDDNLHGNYTPRWVKQGYISREYNHKAHGWNILQLAFNNNETILIFDDDIRNNKKHFYPETPKEFYKHLPWAYIRQSYCANEFIHLESTDNAIPVGSYQQLLVPASGLSWVNMIDQSVTTKVIIYDYNLAALNYWKEHVPKLSNVSYQFMHIDILHTDIDLSILDQDANTFVNLTNVFAYEGTAFFCSLEYRRRKEAQLLTRLKEFNNIVVYQSVRAADGFTSMPTWHTYD
jgi:hypothetical protein